MEIYGIGTVHFENIIAADNSHGIVVDWERTSYTNWSKVLVVGETTNFGTTLNIRDSNSKEIQSNGEEVALVLKFILDNSEVSETTGESQRTVTCELLDDIKGFKHADRYLHWDDVTMMNMLPRCDEFVNPIDPYPGGTLGISIRRFSDDRRMD